MKIKKFNENWQDGTLEEDHFDEEVEAVSNILNDNDTYHKIADAIGIEIDTDSIIFHEIEEFIVDKYKEMNRNDSED